MWQLFLSLERSELNCYCLRETCIRLVQIPDGSGPPSRKITAASCGFPATARLSCSIYPGSWVEQRLVWAERCSGGAVLLSRRSSAVAIE